MLIHATEAAPGICESAILARISGFVKVNPLFRDDGFIGSPEDEFPGASNGDSRYVSELITFIDDEFGVSVSKCEISEENLGSLRALARFVAAKQPYAVG
jgi:acyl carrier protein